jgi:hypothetical protein
VEVGSTNPCRNTFVHGCVGPHPAGPRSSGSHCGRSRSCREVEVWPSANPSPIVVAPRPSSPPTPPGGEGEEVDHERAERHSGNHRRVEREYPQRNRVEKGEGGEWGAGHGGLRTRLRKRSGLEIKEEVSREEGWMARGRRSRGRMA